LANYLLVADVLGFTNIVANLSQNATKGQSSLKDRVDHWIRLVETIRSEVAVKDLRLISDTVIAFEDDSRDGLMRLLCFAKLLLEKGISNSFPIRGAITHGDLVWGDLIYGRPVIDAIKLEKSQDWIGICSVSGLEMPWSWDLVCCYPVPRKSGEIKLSPAVVWSVPEQHDLERQTGTGGLFKAGDRVPWEHQSKLINTLLFGKYCRICQQLHREPKSFWFRSPAHLFSVPEPR
jgi:hypothetical protein